MTKIVFYQLCDKFFKIKQPLNLKKATASSLAVTAGNTKLTQLTVVEDQHL